MAMTIGKLQQEMHHEQIKLDEISASLRRKGDFDSAEKIQSVRSRLTSLAYQPLGTLGPERELMPVSGRPDMTRLQQTMHHEQIALDKIIAELNGNMLAAMDALRGVRQRLTAESYVPSTTPTYTAQSTMPQLKKVVRQY